jgi:hypothetical protein
MIMTRFTMNYLKEAFRQDGMKKNITFKKLLSITIKIICFLIVQQKLPNLICKASLPKL